MQQSTMSCSDIRYATEQCRMMLLHLSNIAVTAILDALPLLQCYFDCATTLYWLLHKFCSLLSFATVLCYIGTGKNTAKTSPLKIAENIGILSRTSLLVLPKIRKTLYYTLIYYPYLTSVKQGNFIEQTNGYIQQCTISRLLHREPGKKLKACIHPESHPSLGVTRDVYKLSSYYLIKFQTKDSTDHETLLLVHKLYQSATRIKQPEKILFWNP